MSISANPHRSPTNEYLSFSENSCDLLRSGRGVSQSDLRRDSSSHEGSITTGADFWVHGVILLAYVWTPAKQITVD